MPVAVGRRVPEEQQTDDEEHARKRRQRPVPAAVEIRRGDGRQHVEAEDHSLRRDQVIQEQRDRKQREYDPQLLVDALKRTRQDSFHNHSSLTQQLLFPVIGRCVRGLKC